MDILKISDDALKLMLTAEDMDTYSLDCKTIAKDRAHSAAVIREILREAGDKCGFYSDGARFFVQIYASTGGECEIFVKRLGGNIMSALEYKRETRDICCIPSVTGHGLFVYSFDKMSPMMHACRRLRDAKYSGESNAYSEDGRNLFYLVLEERSPLPEEHGGRLCTRNTAYYISEHCRLICAGAVEVLGRLA